jgi:saccharopine dehydrogenase (NAD+, L-lysine-forming)
MARLMYWGLRHFSHPPYGTLLKLEAAGECGDKAETASLTLYHADGYWFTAIPAVACLLQVLDRSAWKPGLWFQAHIVEPGRLLRDMQRMGIEVVGDC